MKRDFVRYIDYGTLILSGLVAALCLLAASVTVLFGGGKKHITTRAFSNLSGARVVLMLLGALWAASQVLQLQVIWADNSPFPTGTITKELDEGLFCRLYLVVSLGLLQYSFLLLVLLMVMAPLRTPQDDALPAAVPHRTNRRIIATSFAGGLIMGVLQGAGAWLASFTDDSDSWLSLAKVSFGVSIRSSPYKCWNASVEEGLQRQREQGIDTSRFEEGLPEGEALDIYSHGAGSCQLCMFPLVSLGVCLVGGALYCLVLARAMLWRSKALRSSMVNMRLRKRAARLLMALGACVVALVLLQAASMWKEPHTWLHDLSRAGYALAQAAVILAVAVSLIAAPVLESRSVDRRIAALRELDEETERRLIGGEDAKGGLSAAPSPYGSGFQSSMPASGFLSTAGLRLTSVTEAEGQEERIEATQEAADGILAQSSSTQKHIRLQDSTEDPLLQNPNSSAASTPSASPPGLDFTLPPGQGSSRGHAQIVAELRGTQPPQGAHQNGGPQRPAPDATARPEHPAGDPHHREPEKREDDDEEASGRAGGAQGQGRTRRPPVGAAKRGGRQRAAAGAAGSRLGARATDSLVVREAEAAAAATAEPSASGSGTSYKGGGASSPDRLGALMSASSSNGAVSDAASNSAPVLPSREGLTVSVHEHQQEGAGADAPLLGPEGVALDVNLGGASPFATRNRIPLD